MPVSKPFSLRKASKILINLVGLYLRLLLAIIDGEPPSVSFFVAINLQLQLLSDLGILGEIPGYAEV